MLRTCRSLTVSRILSWSGGSDPIAAAAFADTTAVFSVSVFRTQKPEPPRRVRQVRGTVSNGCYNLGGYTSDATPFEAQFGRALTPRRGPRLGGWPASSLAPLDDRRFMSYRISDRPALGTARRVVGPAE